ncbi:MAG: hypothetical protein IJV72_06280 [Clostridia bacterium]|nr:hypothetical protein [Clostridia bacterium]
MNCYLCNKEIDTIDVGAHRKLIDKSASHYMCRDCLANELGWSRKYLDGIVQLYRERGCMLFPPLKEEDL